jgi:dTDP-4-dehydrorhamnose reductase
MRALQVVDNETGLPTKARRLLQVVRDHAERYGNQSIAIRGGAVECEREVELAKEAEKEQERETEVPRSRARPEMCWPNWSIALSLPSIETASGQSTEVWFNTMP